MPVAEAANLQQALDSAGRIRLELGDYRSSPPITLRSGQHIYGLGFSGGNGSILPQVTVEPGASGALLANVNVRDGLVFPASELVTRHNLIFEISGQIVVNDATLEQNAFVGLENGNISIDTRSSGWLRNNRFIRIRAQNLEPLLTMAGDQSRQSFGNVFLWGNQLTQPSGAVSVTDQRQVNFVGWDDEAYADPTADPIYRFANIDTLRLWTMGGGSPTTNQALFDINATQAQLSNVTMGGPSPAPILLGTDVERAFTFNSRSLVDGNPSGLRLNGIRSVNNDSGSSFQNQGVSITDPLPVATAEAFTSMYTSDSGTPWERPRFRAVPDPTGPNWADDLASQVDSTATLQQRIDTESVVLLDAGIYYISEPLRIGAETRIVGSGADVTAIVAKSADVDIFVHDPSDTSRSRPRIQILDLTLQGGANGVHFFSAPGQEGGQYSEFLFSNLVFRNFSNAGFFTNQIFGLDNGLFHRVDFVDSAHGFKQYVDPKAAPGGSNSGYVDKVVFYGNQFIGNEIGIDLTASRANNLNSIINSRFSDNTSAALVGRNNNDLQLINSVLINNGGAPTVQNVADVISCYFRADQLGVSFLNSARVEGTRFERGTSETARIYEQSDDPFWVPGNMAWANFSFNYVVNSSADDIPVGNVEFGIFINNSLPARPDLSQPAVQVWLGDVLPLADGVTRPRAQLLVGANFRFSGEVMFQSGFESL